MSISLTTILGLIVFILLGLVAFLYLKMDEERMRRRYIEKRIETVDDLAYSNCRHASEGYFMSRKLYTADGAEVKIPYRYMGGHVCPTCGEYTFTQAFCMRCGQPLAYMDGGSAYFHTNSANLEEECQKYEKLHEENPKLYGSLLELRKKVLSTDNAEYRQETLEKVEEMYGSREWTLVK